MAKHFSLIPLTLIALIGAHAALAADEARVQQEIVSAVDAAQWAYGVSCKPAGERAVSGRSPISVTEYRYACTNARGAHALDIQASVEMVPSFGSRPTVYRLTNLSLDHRAYN
jgi:hypothetical protein